MTNKFYMLKNKGFTLIELMLIVILLSVIALIITPVIANSINESKDKLYQVQLDNIKSAARTYMLTKTLDGEFRIIYLKELKKAGLVERNIENPKTDKKFHDCLQIKVTTNGSIYQYEILEDIPDTCEIEN